MSHIKVTPSQLHLGAWAFMTVFRLYVEYKSWKPSLGIFFDLFSAAPSLLDDARDQGLIPHCPQVPWFTYFAFDWGDFLEGLILVKLITLNLIWLSVRL